ncbi:peptidoglycan DD-metalloendopeptidase family protein [Sulfurospirillum barnesii]|uniref:Metalloendopeptidase-like membrane protein n=1 Tax=Sulfurospirillum barnesii (strain ATCC 700032 / DSM 10660 / SES-3) TaxID=760154 RepID=I3XYC1_SULBS|nr:peptidoglycan DD-metalloendopeptidase family protein [Sulfurospirillum barnesii]AFL68945.1 metalloendopeptidase-like membrane protein [Sulfurospirillum barnesii SES-3]
MIKWVYLWLVFLSFSCASYLEELKWPKGETFLTFLEKNQLPLKIYYTLDKEEQELAAEIIAGVKYQVLKSEDHQLEQVLIPIGEELQMHLKKVNNEFVMEITPIVVQEEKRSLAIEIQNSPYLDIISATNNYGLANEFAQSFKGGVNLRNLQKGDKLVLLFQQKRRLGKPFGSTKIDVSMLETAKKQHYIFYYKENYYNQKGEELDSFLLTKPVNYTRISSVFTQKRWHPVLKKYRAHLGIDYAAPTGTPVRSAGNGKVIFVGTKGGYGKTIEVAHDSSYKTLYAHLNGFAKGVRGGQGIKQGQVIGYVGNTGMSTGPHLHFGLYRSNVAINPASVVKMAKSALGGKELKEFMRYSEDLKQQVQVALQNNELPLKEENFDAFYPLEKIQS